MYRSLYNAFKNENFTFHQETAKPRNNMRQHKNNVHGTKRRFKCVIF